MRSVFFGTPAIAVPALQALHQSSQLVGVVCQPDRPKGRGLAMAAPAVKLAAEQLGVAVYQPHKVRNGELEAWLRALDADVAIVLAYGRILPEGVLNTPRAGCLNLHASLLPYYRGAAPIQWAILHGETETGISLMQMDIGLDTGPVYTRRSCAIDEDTNAEQLTERLATLAASMVTLDVPRVLSGELRAEAQDSALATFAPPLGREHGVLDWTRPAHALANQVRALNPQPGATTHVAGKRLRIIAAAVVREVSDALAPSSGPAGQVVYAAGDQLWVQTGDGLLGIRQAQLDGKRVSPARDLINGRVLGLGQQLGDAGAP